MVPPEMPAQEAGIAVPAKLEKLRGNSIVKNGKRHYNMKYYRKCILGCSRYKELGKDKKTVVLDHSNNIACFSNITYKPLQKDTHYILVWEYKKSIPYDDACIRDWINDLNEMGFKCSIEEDDNIYNFYVPVRDEHGNFITKLEMNSCLFLIRYLYHADMISTFPNFYFEIMDEIPEADKFEVMQMAHAYVPEPYFNTNHSLRDSILKKPVSKDRFWNELIKEVDKKVDDNGQIGMTEAWSAEKAVFDKNKSYREIYNLIATKPLQ